MLHPHELGGPGHDVMFKSISSDELALYREIFERSADGIAIIDPQGYYLEQNAAHQGLTGYTTEELQGQTPALHLGQAAFSEITAALQANGTYAGELVSRAKNGSEHIVELAAFAVRDAAGDVVCYVGIKRDVTERHRSQEELLRHFSQLQTLHRMTTAVSRPLNLQQIYHEALDCLQHALAAPRASILLFDPDGVMRFKAARGLSTEYQRAVEGHTPWKPDDSDARAFGIDDIARDMEPSELRDTILGEGIRACAFVPLLNAGRVLGKFMLYHNRPHEFTDKELQLAQSVGTQIASAIGRFLTQQQLSNREHQFKALAENAPDIISRFSTDQRFLYVNPAIGEAMSLSPEQVIGKRIDELPIAPEILAMWRKRIMRVVATGTVEEFEYSFPTPRGVRQYNTRVVPEHEQDGALTSILTLTRDITERVQSEERQRFLAEFSNRLAESPDYESTLLNLAHLMIETLADGCAIDIANSDQTLRRMCVISRDPSKARLVEEMEARFPTPLDAPVGHVQAFRTGQPGLYSHFTEEILQAASSCEEHYQLWRQLDMQSCMCLPLNARGRTLGVLTLVSHDPTHHFTEADLEFGEELARRAALVLDNARLYQEARDASMAKSAFLATMSHELRTPLNAILGYAELMELGVAGPVTEQQSQQLERISASAWHLLTVIEEILTFSRVEAGREEVRLESVTVGELIAEAVSMIEPAALAKGLQFTLDMQDRDYVLRTDRGKVRQILLNLLSNAVKFTEVGRIACQVVTSNSYVRFRISDTGIGMAPEHRERAFEPFWQAAQGATRKAGGTGLGLTVSRQLAQLLGGELTLESALGIGSTFVLLLPAQQASFSN